MNEANTSVSTISGQPRTAPTMASIFTSPMPMPSTPRTRSYRAPVPHSTPPPATVPITEETSPGGRNAAAIQPTTMPPSVISLGRIRQSRSVRNSTTSAAANASLTASSGVGPNHQACRTNSAAVSSSTSG